MTTCSPIVSVVMPVYNGAAYLREALDSILAQTYKDFEFIIVDDGSTDASPDILREYASQDLRIRIVSQRNQGVPVALNAGLSIATGRYVARMDADDISFPERLEKQVRYLDVHPEVAVLGTQVINIDANGHQVKYQVRMPCDPLKVACRMVSLWSMYHPSVMFRKDVILSLGGYRDIEGGEDLDLWLRVSAKAHLANLQELLFKYRFHQEQITVTKKFDLWIAIYANSSEELFDIPAYMAERIYECRMFFYVLPWVLRSAGKIARRFNVSFVKILLCREFLCAWLRLAGKQDPLTASLLVVLKVFSV